MLDIIDAALSQNQATIEPNVEPNSDQVGDQVGDQVKALLAVMGDGDYSAQALLVRLSLSRKPTFRKHYLNPAIAAGLVVMKYPESPRSPKQSYRKL